MSLPTPRRERKPISKMFSQEQVEKLSSRFYALKSRAKTKGIPFHWDKLTPFIKDLERVYGGTPNREFRLKFALGLGIGYCAESLVSEEEGGAKVNSGGNSGGRRRNAGPGPSQGELATELAIVLLTGVEEEFTPIEDSVAEAASNLQ